MQVTPASTALGDPALDLVASVRDGPAPGPVAVAGESARFVDQLAAFGGRLPLALFLLALTTLVILFAMTGSVVLPLKALVMNVLGLSAAFGLLVLVFQDGRLESLLGYTSQGALEVTQPIVLLAIAFGLSTDYGVFLLTRIKEAHDAGAPNEARGGDRPAAHRPDRDRRRAAAVHRDRLVRDVEHHLRQAGRHRDRAGGPHRRDDRALPPGAGADEAPRRAQLVGAGAAGPPARAIAPGRARRLVDKPRASRNAKPGRIGPCRSKCRKYALRAYFRHLSVASASSRSARAASTASCRASNSFASGSAGTRSSACALRGGSVPSIAACMPSATRRSRGRGGGWPQCWPPGLGRG